MTDCLVHGHLPSEELLPVLLSALDNSEALPSASLNFNLVRVAGYIGNGAVGLPTH